VKKSKAHKEFIRLVANGEPQSDAYKATVGNPKATTAAVKSKASNLAKKYAKEIDTETKRLQVLATSIKDDKVVQEALNSILSQAEVDAELCSIVSGTAMVEKIIVVAGKVQVIKSAKPDHGDKLRAIDLYNKRFGSYAPIENKVAVTNINLSTLTYEQLKDLAKGDSEGGEEGASEA